MEYLIDTTFNKLVNNEPVYSSLIKIIDTVDGKTTTYNLKVITHNKTIIYVAKKR
jgi:hypothetical protein